MVDDKEVSFEELFPNLHYYSVHYNSIRMIHNKDKIFFIKKNVEEQCLDRVRVREAIEKATYKDSGVTPPYDLISKDKLLKELGLNE